MSQNLANFFSDPRENSLVKASIVSKYFETWANIILQILKNQENRYGRGKGQIAYVDLFAGPGVYDDGTPSTPVLVLEKVLKNPELCERMVIVFNDGDSHHVESLRNVVDSFDGLDNFKYKPVIANIEVNRELAGPLRSLPNVPTLLFLDGWGYKELSIELFESILQKWGSDCIIFFNFNRINAAIDNPRMVESIVSLFGASRAEKLRTELLKSNPYERELVIIEAFSAALKASSTDGSSRYVLPFRFKNAGGTKTSHHLIHISRHALGYQNMKEIMAKESSEENQGVASFEYSVPTERQPFLFSLSRPRDQLAEMLLRDFAGQKLRMIEIYERHNIDTPFVKKNYKEVLWQLEEEGKITASKHKRNTFGDNVYATFPK